MGSEWETVKLGDIAEKVTVGFVGSMADKYVDDGIPFLRSLNIQPYRVSTNDLKFISDEFNNEIAKSQLFPGDVVIVRTGNTGTTTVIPEWLTEANCSDLVIVRTGENLDPYFLAYYLNAPSTQYTIGGHNVGSVQQHFNVRAAQSLQVTIPPLSEQRAIAHILGSLDDKIEANRRMNDTLEATARAIFKSWFVDFDPVHAKANGEQPYGMDAETVALFPDSFENSELGMIPSGWTTPSLHDSATYINGAAYKNIDFDLENKGLPVIKIAELKSGVTGQTKFTQKALDDKYFISDGEILFSWSGNPETSIDTFIWTGGDAWLNQHIFRVIPHSDIEKSFIYFVLRYLKPEFTRIATNKQTTGLGHVTRGDMKRMLIVSPTEDVMKAFADIAGNIWEKIFLNELENRTLAELRDTLLPRLISGELRVEDVAWMGEE